LKRYSPPENDTTEEGLERLLKFMRSQDPDVLEDYLAKKNILPYLADLLNRECEGDNDREVSIIQYPQCLILNMFVYVLQSDPYKPL
jgi:hypothetical protein